MDADDADYKLLQILCTEIHRDGGAALVRDLKDYHPSIHKLLKRCSQRKLLAFLERYPEIFGVDRTNLPHIVYLNGDQYVGNEEVPIARQREAKTDLMKRMMCILQKEAAKKARRGDDSYNRKGANTAWLLRQCKKQLHTYLRLSGRYRKLYADGREVQVMGSEAWASVVMDEFLTIAEECCNVDDGRICLRDTESFNGGAQSEVDVEVLASKIVERVERDGGTHISLSLLLHRHPELQPLLGGRDLMQLKEENEGCFDGIDVFTKDNHVYFSSQRQNRTGRMEVDETGKFSVISARWGAAFASLLAKHCRDTLGSASQNTIAIDITAACGGLALPLAKAFQRVIAIEIDAHRAELCRRNMAKHGVSQQVDVRNKDSIELIPQLAEELGPCPKVIVIDPPWGGKHYKSEGKPITMGRWSMVEVVTRVAEHLSPSVVGLRMPVDFDAGEFLGQMDAGGVAMRAVEVKRVGPQLFLILAA
ncbi:hypothetical protein ACHAXT_010463 [Thalassiosira profunda]